MVRPSGTWGTGSTRVRAGRPKRHEPRARARYMAAPATWPDAPRARIRSCRVARRLPLRRRQQAEEDGLRVIGMDIHRVFAEVVALSDGKVTRLGRVDMRRDRLEAFARSTLTRDDHVVVEATGNAAAVVEVLGPHVGRVVVANPKQVRLIADAKVKTDRIDATVLAQLYASGFLPEVWIPDQRTAAMRRQVAGREEGGRRAAHPRTGPARRGTARRGARHRPARTRRRRGEAADDGAGHRHGGGHRPRRGDRR